MRRRPGSRLAVVLPGDRGGGAWLPAGCDDRAHLPGHQDLRAATRRAPRFRRRRGARGALCLQGLAEREAPLRARATHVLVPGGASEGLVRPDGRTRARREQDRRLLGEWHGGRARRARRRRRRGARCAPRGHAGDEGLYVPRARLHRKHDPRTTAARPGSRQGHCRRAEGAEERSSPSHRGRRTALPARGNGAHRRAHPPRRAVLPAWHLAPDHRIDESLRAGSWIALPPNAVPRRGMDARLTRALVLLLACGAASAAAQSWPQRAVHVIVPFVAGGNTDSQARIVTERLNELLGQPFVVENKVGAGGAIAAEFVAKSTPDGYTLFFAASPQFSLPLVQKVNFDPL